MDTCQPEHGLTAEAETTTHVRYTVQSCAPDCGAAMLPTSSVGTLGVSDTFQASYQHSSAYVVRAIAYRAGWADSSVSQSETFRLKQIHSTPTFTPDGGTNADGDRQVEVGVHTKENIAVPHLTASVYAEGAADLGGDETVGSAALLDGEHYIEVSVRGGVSTRSATLAAWVNVSTDSPDTSAIWGAAEFRLRTAVSKTGRLYLSSTDDGTNGQCGEVPGNPTGPAGFVGVSRWGAAFKHGFHSATQCNITARLPSVLKLGCKGNDCGDTTAPACDKVMPTPPSTTNISEP